MHLRDLEHHHLLIDIATKIAVNRALVLMFFEHNSLPMMNYTHTNLQRIGMAKQTLFIADSLPTCESIPSIDNCYWSSQILWNAPSDSDVLKRYWDGRFRFYYTKKNYLLRLIKSGFSVLQADIDTLWNANPLPVLQRLNIPMVFQWDSPFANAGMIYAQPSKLTLWILEELCWRIQLFQNHPEIIPRIVEWSKRPYYSNSDDQTLFNDVIINAALNKTMFSSTAKWEDRNMKRHGGSKIPFTNRSEFKDWQKSITRMRHINTKEQYSHASPCTPHSNFTKHSHISIFRIQGERIAISPTWMFGHFPHKKCRFVTHLSALRGGNKKMSYIKEKSYKL